MSKILVTTRKKISKSKTNAEKTENMFTDPRDGQTYRTVKIGNLVWLAENFSYNCEGSYAYNDDEKKVKKYGRLYTWNAAINSVPEGWHLPTEKEFEELESWIQEHSENAVGTVLMSSTTDWKKDKKEEIPQGTDEFGFCALPAGARSFDGDFFAIRTGAIFWTAAERGKDHALGRFLNNCRMFLGSNPYRKDQSISVRLVQDYESDCDRVTDDSASLPQEGSFTDPRDGQVYKTIKIGDQEWLAENFRYNCDDSYAYDNDEENVIKYGRLYTWEAAKNCIPTGWHLPTKEEFKKLERWVRDHDNNAVGTNLKSSSDDWEDDEGTPKGVDKFGFCALPAGYRCDDGDFDFLGSYADFWSASDCSDKELCDKEFSYLFELSYDSEDGSVIPNYKTSAFSVRLVRD